MTRNRAFVTAFAAVVALVVSALDSAADVRQRWSLDLDNLKRKIDAGASRAIAPAALLRPYQIRTRPSADPATRRSRA